jgi:D-alanine-D-alanine ligase
MYICVLSSPPDDPDIPYDPSAYLKEYRWEHHIVSPQNLRGQIKTLVEQGFDVFFNLCDGTPDDDVSGIGLVLILEELGVAFTGANSLFFDPTRAGMKAAAVEADIPFPGSIFVSELKGINKADATLCYPLLVKPPHGFASMGITRESRVTNAKSLELQALHTIREYGSALIEEFIEGREFTVLVAENPNDSNKPIAFQPVEFIFPDGESFKHYDMKWKDYARMSVTPVREPALNQRLRELASRQFKYMQGNGYARCDYRMNDQGVVFMLEINPNCGVFYPPHEPGSADFILLNDPLGHAGFLDLILNSALKRKLY